MTKAFIISLSKSVINGMTVLDLNAIPIIIWLSILKVNQIVEFTICNCFVFNLLTMTMKHLKKALYGAPMLFYYFNKFF